MKHIVCMEQPLRFVVMFYIQCSISPTFFSCIHTALLNPSPAE